MNVFDKIRESIFKYNDLNCGVEPNTVFIPKKYVEELEKELNSKCDYVMGLKIIELNTVDDEIVCYHDERLVLENEWSDLSAHIADFLARYSDLKIVADKNGANLLEVLL